MKKKVTPIITGIRPQGKKKLIALHYHPDAIKKSIKELGEIAEEDKIKMLFEDISVLVNWALDRLPLAEPPKEKVQHQDDTAPTNKD